MHKLAPLTERHIHTEHTLQWACLIKQVHLQSQAEAEPREDIITHSQMKWRWSGQSSRPTKRVSPLVAGFPFDEYSWGRWWGWRGVYSGEESARVLPYQMAAGCGGGGIWECVGICISPSEQSDTRYQIQMKKLLQWGEMTYCVDQPEIPNAEVICHQYKS